MGAIAFTTELERAALERAASGDEQAFAALYRAHADSVFRLLTRLVGPVAERDDLLQETFLRLHRALPSFESRSSLSTFLYRITVCVAIDHLRARSRHPATVEIDDEIAALGLGAREHAEVADALANLASLTPEQRVAFVLREVIGHSYPEIGKLVGCFTTTARMRVAAARAALARRTR
jgi:RNA polymerase sigma-70 factor, ECF subfamily